MVSAIDFCGILSVEVINLCYFPRSFSVSRHVVQSPKKQDMLHAFSFTKCDEISHIGVLRHTRKSVSVDLFSFQGRLGRL